MDDPIRALAIVNQCKRVVAVISFIILCVSLFIIVGWQFHQGIYQVNPLDWIPMRANSSLCFFMAGLALFAANKSESYRAKGLIIALSVGILFIASLTFIQYALQVNIGIDQLFIKKLGPHLQGEHPGRMIFINAINFTFAGLAFLFLLMKEKTIYPTQFCAGIIFVLSLFSFCNLMYGVNDDYALAHLTKIPILTMALFFMLSLGIFLLTPKLGLTRFIFRRSPATYHLRFLIPAVLLGPIVITYSENLLERAGMIEPNMGDSLVTVGSFLFISFIMTLIAWRVIREEEKLRAAEDLNIQKDIIFREFADNVDIVIFRASADTSKLYYISPAYEKIWGQTTESLYKNPMAWYEAILPEDKETAHKQIVLALVDKLSSSAEYRIRRGDGAIRNIFARAMQLRDKNNKVFGMIGIAVDVTDMKAEKKYLQGQNDILRILEIEKSLADSGPKILKELGRNLDLNLGEIWLINNESSSLRCVSVWHTKTPQMLRYNKKGRRSSLNLGEGIPGKIWETRQPLWISNYAETEQYARSALASMAELNCVFGIPIIYQDKIFGVMMFYSSQVQAFNNDLLTYTLSVGKLYGEFIQRIHAVEKIHNIDRNDVLTGLLKRSTFEEELDGQIEVSGKKARTLAVIIVDIDRFRFINEALGHDAGDVILKLVAKRLEGMVNVEAKKNNLARLNAAKFVLYISDIEHEEEVIEHANKIERSFKSPFHVNHKELFLSVSIGISLYPKHGLNAKALIANADLAVTHAQDQGGKKSVVFNTKQVNLASEKLVLTTDLHEAILNKQFYLEYQPQVDLKTGRIGGAEALIRWKHPTKGLILPSVFIECAEQAGLIAALNEHVLRLAFQELGRNWAGPPISINVSAQQFKDKYHLVEYLEGLMNEFNVNPKFIELEITESMLMEDVQHNIAVLGALNHLNIQCAIDDFGTGFSSFNYLFRIPAHKVKIDRSFITDISNNSANAAIVKSMIAMLHSLGKKVVAEGAELLGEVQFLKENGCDLVQGYFFYKPLPLEEFVALIEAQNMKNVSPKDSS